jgi:hypothetical protein
MVKKYDIRTGLPQQDGKQYTVKWVGQKSVRKLGI